MKKTNVWRIVISVAVFVFAITAISGMSYYVTADFNELDARKVATYRGATGTVAGVQVEEASIVVDRPGGNTLSYTFDLREGMTVLDALKEFAVAYGIELQTKQFDFGVLIEAIDGMGNGQDGKYWIYYLNGEQALVAVDTQSLNAGDSIAFRFETSTF